MKICSQCSAQNPDNARFCRNCGTQLNAGAGPIGGGHAPSQPASASAFVQAPVQVPDSAPVPASTLAPVSAPVPVSAPEAEQAPGTTHRAPYNPANPQAGGVKPDRKMKPRLSLHGWFPR